MPHGITRGKGFFGGVSVKSGDLDLPGNFSSIEMTAVTISPANSTVAANTTEERSYTTGLANVGLVANDMIVLSPKTALTSNLTLGGARCQSANTLHIQWSNPSAAATAPSATDYDILVFHRRGA